MNIDELTLGQIKQLQGIIGGAPAKATPTVEKKRAVVVVDRGWIFAGDMTTTPDGLLRLERAVWVFRWESVGFAAVVKDWRAGKADIRQVDPVEVPFEAVIFRVPVADDWGIK